jgi:hypothetical protein
VYESSVRTLLLVAAAAAASPTVAAEPELATAIMKE